jgi:hypothetical protein
LTSITNLTVNNLDLANRIVLSSQQSGLPDVGILPALATLNLDQNRFSIGENNILYIKSEVSMAPANVLVWAW